MKKITEHLLIILLIIFLPTAFLLPLFVEVNSSFIAIPYSFSLLATIVYLFPIWSCLLGITDLTGATFNKDFNCLFLIKLSLMIAIILLYKIVYISIALSVVLLFLIILTTIKKLKFYFNKKLIWVLSAIIILFLITVLSFSSNLTHSRNKADEHEPILQETNL